MTIDQFVNIVFIQSTLSAVVALTCLYRYKERGIVIRLIGYAFLLGSIINLLPFAFVHLGLNKYNNYCSIVFIIFYFTLITLLYRSQFEDKGIHWMILIVLFILMAIFNVIFFQKTNINSFSYIVLSFVIIIYTIAFFYKLMIELPAQHIHQLPMFWINSAFLFYHSGSFFLFAFTSYIVFVLKNNLMVYWTFHNALNIIEHLIILVGIYYDLKTLPPRGSMMREL